MVSGAGTTLLAGRDVTIGAAQETGQKSHFKETKRSGFLYSGGGAFTSARSSTAMTRAARAR